MISQNPEKVVKGGDRWYFLSRVGGWGWGGGVREIFTGGLQHGAHHKTDCCRLGRECKHCLKKVGMEKKEWKTKIQKCRECWFKVDCDPLWASGIYFGMKWLTKAIKEKSNQMEDFIHRYWHYGMVTVNKE